MQVGIDPTRPPRPIWIRAAPGPGRRPGARYGGVDVHWCVGATLTRPLADRPVYDVGMRDRAAWWAARMAWQSAH